MIKSRAHPYRLGVATFKNKISQPNLVDAFNLEMLLKFIQKRDRMVFETIICLIEKDQEESIL